MHGVMVLNGEEKSVTRELWENVFTEDSIGFLDYYYKYKCRNNHVYSVDAGDKAVSMLHCNPYLMKVNDSKITADYIVGVATGKNFRHRGFMTELLSTALNDMAHKDRAFAFLMPAAEAIYTPFGFRSVYSQPVYKKSINIEKGVSCDINEECSGKCGSYDIVPITDNMFSRVSGQINIYLEKSYDVFTLRTEEYYQDLTKQYGSDGGKVCCVWAEDRLAACFNCWITDSRAEITELICFNNDRERLIAYIEKHFSRLYQIKKLVIRGEVPEYCECENRIMLRITSVSSMLSLIRSDKALRLKLNVVDELIPQNNRSFIWDISGDESYVMEAEENIFERDADTGCSLKAALYETGDFDCELNIGIEELALWLFKGEISEDMPDLLRSIRPVSRIFINEIV